MPAPPDLGEFCEMVRRNLGARSVTFAAEPEQPWVAYWQLPPNGFRAKSRVGARSVRGR
jgi:hypothetical protein